MTNKTYWLLLTLAALSFLPALNFYYVGEEAIHPIIAMEIHQHGRWMFQSLYGQDVQHIPFYNWLILFPADFFGWDHMLLVARTITISATILSAVVLAWFSRRVFHDNSFALFAAVAYLTLADVSLYRGWLAYVDPLFALLVFTAIAALVVATLEQNWKWLWLAALTVTLAFMSRTLTAYVFYGGALFVLLWHKQQRTFLFSTPSLLMHGIIFLIPLAWSAYLGNAGQDNRMLGEILAKLSPLGLLPYLEKLLVFPLETLLRLSPVLPLAVYFMLRKRVRRVENFPAPFHALAWIALLNYLPYWLSPQSSMRYILPLCPLFAVLGARIIWRSGDAAVTLTRNWIVGALALKFILVLAVFPYYQEHYRGKNYYETAADIDRQTRGYPLYVTDDSAPGLNVTAYLDQRRYPAQALQKPPTEWQAGYVISRSAEESIGEIYRQYRLAGDDLYVLCRGAACAANAK